MDLSPNITMKKVLESNTSDESSNCSDDKMINDFINDFIINDDGDGDVGDGNGDGQVTTPEITDLFFDMKERWQSAYLDDLAKGGKCEYDDISKRRGGRNPPGRIKSFMSSVAGAVKHRGRGGGEGRSRGVSRSSSESCDSERRSSSDSSGIIDKAAT